MSSPDRAPVLYTARPSPLERLASGLRPTLRYWMKTEVHVYAFSVAANALLSFFPFLIVMLSLCRYVFRWRAAVDAIFLSLNDYFPDQLGEFLRRNLVATVEARGPFQVASVVLLLFTANGIFEPLEVALNRIWGITTNRSFFKNQLVSLGLIFSCGGLALLSTMLTALNQEYLRKTFQSSSLGAFLAVVGFKMAAIPLIILLLFLIYWLLPNGKVPFNRALGAAIIIGVLLEVLKYVNLVTWSWLNWKLAREYGPFKYSVTLILWSFFASMLILAGGEWAARARLPGTEPPAAPVGNGTNDGPG